MCLLVKNSVRVRFEASPRGERVKAWKIAGIDNTKTGAMRLSSTAFGRGRTWRLDSQGFFTSNRRGQNIASSEKERIHDWYTNTYRTEIKVNKGIHVYLKREDAKYELCDDERLVPVWCYKKDLVARGEHSGDRYDQAVFMKVQLIQRKDKNKCLRK